MVTMDLLEQDNYYDSSTRPTTNPSIISSSVGEYNEDSLPNHLDYFFLDEVPSSKLILHGGSFRRYGMVTLVCLSQSTLVSFMGWLLIDTPSFVSGLNAWIVVFGVEHEEYLEAVDVTSYVGTIPTWLASYFLVGSSTVLCLLPGACRCLVLSGLC